MARSTIDRRDNGRYRARYVGPDKRWKSKTFNRKVDAERWLRHQLSTVDRGEWIDPALRRTRFGELADRWLPTIAGLRPKTRANYESLLSCHVLPTFGEVELAGINRVAARGVARRPTGQWAECVTDTAGTTGPVLDPRARR